MTVPSTLLLLSLLSLLLLLHFPSPSSANEGNLIVTGDVLQTDTQLSVPNAVFVIQNDCNLVLYNKGSGFQSGTSGSGPNCTAAVSDYGSLQIKNSTGDILWSTPANIQSGEYAAILQPDGQVGIYGPSLWTTSPIRGNIFDDRVQKINKEPSAPNLLFSSEVLNEKSKLVSRDYALEVTETCRLEFTKAFGSEGVLWASPTNPATGQHCFIRLNHHGQLALIDDYNRIVWKTKPAYADGIYVLVVKINGEAVIYGKRIWST